VSSLELGRLLVVLTPHFQGEVISGFQVNSRGETQAFELVSDGLDNTSEIAAQISMGHKYSLTIAN